ncbi:hypothetical protein BC939DRAFT_229296 [Gamsiella multidivaricata]|uniref:uncharacterized protein n=1 Tax=Gamsiella multidivaricata TaxID=101098 RepID=UPI0022212024|nr:uncharacterized protein BC939DRAFT_229296 [Gamsiella multidivaricata]KAI7820702.1 hypothetical protein BC939DRAFT_229296 [Gamsiella multidivaricata]
MNSQAAIYICAFIVLLLLLGIFIGFIHRKHLQQEREQKEFRRVARERTQQTIDLNLPPYYIDHVRDPICIYEHELPSPTSPYEGTQRSTTGDSAICLEMPQQDSVSRTPSTPIRSTSATPVVVVVCDPIIEQLDIAQMPPPPPYETSNQSAGGSPVAEHTSSSGGR